MDVNGKLILSNTTLKIILISKAYRNRDGK
jgi:hypothetical protein